MYKKIGEGCMEKDKIGNLITFLHTKQLLYAFMFWAQNRDGAFVKAWHNSLEKLPHSFVFDEETKEQIKTIDNGVARELLKEHIEDVENYMLIQSFVYAYDNIKYRIKEIQDNEKAKDLEVQLLLSLGAQEGSNILNLLRNNIAHNDDALDIPRFYYMPKEKMFYFNMNENGSGIILSLNHLTKLIKFFNQYVEKIRSDNYGIQINTTNLLDPKCNFHDQVFEMFRLDNGEEISPDSFQIKALQNLMHRAKEGNFIPRNDYVYFYPHKDSSVNNSVKMLQECIILEELYKNRGMNTNLFGSYMMKELGTKYADFASIKDMCYPLFANLLFQMCSNNSLSLLQECIENIDPNINMRKVRNSIMHGTFFFDRCGSLVFYDANIKTEEKLKYVAKLDFSQLIDLFNNYTAIKFPSCDLYSIGSEGMPFPHVVDFDKDELQ